jgi:FemAB family protein
LEPPSRSYDGHADSMTQTRVDVPALSSSSAIEDLLAAAGLEARLRSNAPDDWLAVWPRLPWQPAAYCAAAVDYETAYFGDTCALFRDVSMVVCNDRKPCGIWPLSVWHQSGVHVGTCGGPVAAPLLRADVSERTAKRLFGAAIRVVRELCGALGCEEVRFHSNLADPGVRPMTSGWHHQLLAGGAHVAVRHELTLDLERDGAAIRSGFRKSYKPLISAGITQWSVELHRGPDADERRFKEFRELHRAAAGRVTRSPLTWDLQWGMLRANQAFLVTLHDPADAMRMVGAALFEVTRDEAVYSVGAFDRALFTRPLGHVVQSRAIEEMKRLELRRYVLGARPYPGDEPAPTQKELNIADFKQGFASHLGAKFVLTLPIPCASAHENTNGPSR